MPEQTLNSPSPARHIPLPISAALVFSGGAALTYEIIWTRLLLLVFGTTTHSVVAVLSAFMAGLAIGSYLFGNRADRTGNLLRLYAILEIVAGVAALVSLPGIVLIQELYTALYHAIPSTELLFFSKWFLTLITLLPATIMMGGTLPVLVAYFSQTKETGSVTGRLYALNTTGAVAGTLGAGFVMIELYGFATSVQIFGVVQIFVGLMLYWLYAARPNPKGTMPRAETEDTPTQNYPGWKLVFAMFAFGVSGLTAMAYEVAWTRLLTPTTGTYIYAFSLILALVLIGIALGSAIAVRLYARTQMTFVALGLTQVGMALGAMLSLFANSRVLNLNLLGTLCFTILPTALCSGMTFAIIAKLPHAATQRGRFIGSAYAWNTIGSLIGPIIAGYVLLATVGTSQTILILAFVNGVIGIALLLLEESRARQTARRAAIGIAALGLVSIAELGWSRSDWVLERMLAAQLEKFKASGYVYQYKEDETAAVLAYKTADGSDNGLKVDGVGMTGLQDETKMMAHIPLLVHPDPKDMLVIAFGMGTTFRSAMSYGIRVDAVELVPSVPAVFPIFFSDANDLLRNPRARVMINDGRNYVRLTEKKYDVITVDPPPPLNAAGTTVLYSREFYEQGKKALRPGGLFSEWLFYGGRDDDFRMLVKSFIQVFPYVTFFRSPQNMGIYTVGSDQPINHTGSWVAPRFASPAVRQDMNEWNRWEQSFLNELYLGDRQILERYAAGVSEVSDDHPRTEYFILRRTSSYSPQISNDILMNSQK